MTSSFALLSFSIVLAVTVISLADESPGFFLKITKNVPRLGRRSDKQFESYFFKNAKQIPRIGRRNEAEDGTSPTEPEHQSWLDEMSSLSKRGLINPILATGNRGYNVVQPVNANTLIDLIEKNAIPHESIKFVHWKDFDRALQSDNDLYTKVFSLGRKPDHQLKDDLNLSRFIPFFGNANDRDDYLFYRGEKEMYPTRENDLLHYNNL